MKKTARRLTAKAETDPLTLNANAQMEVIG